MEEYAYILDYMPQGVMLSNGRMSAPICCAIGETEFKLFNLAPKRDAQIAIGDRVYIGKDSKKRDSIDFVKGRISYDELTNYAKSEMEEVIGSIVRANPAPFIRFYNESEPLTLKKHALEELPGLGKKMMMAILEERKKEKFKDFADLDARVPVLKNGAVGLIVARISLEIRDTERRRNLFVSK